VLPYCSSELPFGSPRAVRDHAKVVAETAKNTTPANTQKLRVPCMESGSDAASGRALPAAEERMGAGLLLLDAGRFLRCSPPRSGIIAGMGGRLP